MKKFALGAAFAALALSPAPSSALTTGAEYSAFGLTTFFVDVTGGVVTAEKTASSLVDDTFTVGSGVSTGFGPDQFAIPMLPLAGPVPGLTTLEATLTADAAGEAVSPFGFVGGPGPLFPAAPGDFTVGSALTIVLTNDSPTDTVLVALDYFLDVSTDAGLVDELLRLEDAVAFSGAAIEVTHSVFGVVLTDSIDAVTDALFGPFGPGGASAPLGPPPPFTLAPGETLTIDAFAGAHGFAAITSEIPVPAALPLMATAIGVFAWVGRRRRAV